MKISELNGNHRQTAASMYRDGSTVREILTRLQISTYCAKEMLTVLRAEGVEIRPANARRIYSLREDAFDALTDESAYWIGFLLADGCIQLRLGAVILAIHPKDGDQVKAFCDFLGTDTPIRHVDRERMFNGVMGRNQLHSVRITCKRLVERLVSWGVTERKSKTAKADERLAENPHFWRGYMDGNGSIFLANNKSRTPMPSLCFCSASETLLHQFIAFCRLHVETKAQPIRHNNAWYFRLGARKATDMAMVLYGVPGPALSRKSRIAKEFLLLSNKYDIVR